MSGSSAHTIRCSNCNADIEIRGLVPSVRCQFCGHVQSVDPALLATLGDYSEAVHDQMASAEKERQHAAAWDRSVAQMGGKRRGLVYIMGFGLMAGLPMLAAFVGILLMKTGTIPPEKTQYLSFACMGAAMVGIAIYFAWYFTAGQKAKRTTVPVASVTCPTCGAASAMQAGQVIERCLHCGAALMPSESVRREGVDAARSEARQARLERYRAERTGMAAVQSYGMKGPWLVMIIGGSVLLPLGVGTVYFTVMMIAGKEAYSPGIFVLWAMCLAAVGGAAGIVWMQRSRKRRLRQGLESLAARFRGTILGGLPGTVEWLNTHWAGPFDVHDMTQSTYNDSAALVVDGLPALVDLDPIPAARQIRPRALVLVACDIPGAEEGLDTTLRLPPRAMDLLGSIKSYGFDVQMQAGGLLARADAMLTRRIVKEDGAVAGLADVVTRLGSLAKLLSQSVDPLD